jgi:hypothetical protein
MTVDRFTTKAALIRDAVAVAKAAGDRGLDLMALVRLMRGRSQEHAYVSSLYFAGVEVDHPYFLRTDRVALGIAVLPEDRQTALILTPPRVCPPARVRVEQQPPPRPLLIRRIW